jgi:cell division protease FtsH
MRSRLRIFTADHRYLVEVAARRAGFAKPVALAVDPALFDPLIRAARQLEFWPVDGAFVRYWSFQERKADSGTQFGMRAYELDGIRFVWVLARYLESQVCSVHDFAVVDAKDYRRLFRKAQRLHRDSEPRAATPVLPPEQLATLYRNTIGYLESANLQRIREYGGRSRRGVLLTGAPGNGKTMACRWIWEQCRERRWEWHLVTPDAYRSARRSCDAAEAVRELFTVHRRGVVFFDDMDLALRDRETVQETEDQAVFLSAIDGLPANEGVVFVFTTNCALDLIDRAFKRPGRIDVMLHLEAPSASLRRELLSRWHPEIRDAIDLTRAVSTTDGYSFAEIEELRNLLVMRWLEHEVWDWDGALWQFDVNRNELRTKARRQVGFASVPGVSNGAAQP